MREHWSRTLESCPRCGRAALRTRRGTQILCPDIARCGWYRHEAPPPAAPKVAGLLARFAARGVT